MIAGRYSLDREVGRGGMGAVWLGRDEVLGRPVALKRLGMAPGATAPDVERAGREARLAARLSHPHVVAVFDLVDEGDVHWLVMEYVEGTTLAGLVRDHGALDPARAASLVAQAADALAAAHEAGIVHRDVKPSNILVTHDGQVKLSDFGIARAEADPSLTQTGLVTGSPAYLAPEVASGGTATDASDVWSLGATLFHALEGRPPYEVGDNLLGALYRIVHEEPPRVVDPGWLGPLLQATMTRDPADRWTMAQVRDHLEAGPGAPLPAPLPRPSTTAEPAERTQVVAPVTLPPPGPEAPAARRSGALAIFVGVAIVALLTVLGFAIGFGDDGDEAPATTTPSDGQSQTTAPTDPETSPSDEPTATAEGMTDFIGNYLETAASDPAAGFAMLTPGFQDASGGLAGYQGNFWGKVKRVRDIRVTDADPDTLVVAYTYTYQFQRGGPTTEDIVLQLELQDDGSYLIAGEA